MSEELRQRNLTEHGLQIGDLELYQLGSTTLGQLRKYKIIPHHEYTGYLNYKPDAILVDRRNKSRIKVVLVLEYKDGEKFRTRKDRRETIEQCNTLCQLLRAEIGIATDSSEFIWFNPREFKIENQYKEKKLGKHLSYTLISDVSGTELSKPFKLDQSVGEKDVTRLTPQTRQTLLQIDEVRRNLSDKNSRILPEIKVNPTQLAKQIWQDVWSVSGATPEKCLYTFVELFIFKYLSDLGVLDRDQDGNDVSFTHVYSLPSDLSFRYYSRNVRPHLKVMFPENPEDGTTIINGTVLNSRVPEHSAVFFKILRKLSEFGELKNIDPSFKSQVFEDFMKESISKKNWGQFFTPRNIIDSIIEISDIDKLSPGAKICDPACGVGGFILEPLRVKKDGVKFYYSVNGKKVLPRYQFTGFDKGFEKEEKLTIILAKANMLIFLSELLKGHSTLNKEFANLFNKTFKLLSGTILGTLSKLDTDTYDLILTNPPYVTSGSSNYKEAIKRDSELQNFYSINGLGVESLFLEWVVRCLKPECKAFVIVPDGILNRINESKLRNFLKQECIIDGVISLPLNAFYTTSKKTYILAITKKPGRSSDERKGIVQETPVFTYLVSTIGETLDINRFPTPDSNDLLEMVSLFNQFKGSRNDFKSTSQRCKIQPIDRFDPDQHWSIDRWWSLDERKQLGIVEMDDTVTFEEFIDRVDQISEKITLLRSLLRELQ